jgi:type I restriction enzyme, R subunit
MSDYKTIAESNNFIVLNKYAKEWKVSESYQSEYDLEQEFIQDLQNQGYEYVPGLNTLEKLLANARAQLQALNNMQFSDGEWMRFVETWLDRPSDSMCLTMVIFRTFTCWIKRTLRATRCRSSNSLSKRAATPTATM